MLEELGLWEKTKDCLVAAVSSTTAYIGNAKALGGSSDYPWGREVFWFFGFNCGFEAKKGSRREINKNH